MLAVVVVMVENAATSSRSTVAVAVAAAVAVAGAAVVVAGGTAAAAEGIAPYCATLKGIFSNLRWEVLWDKEATPFRASEWYGETSTAKAPISEQNIGIRDAA